MKSFISLIILLIGTLTVRGQTAKNVNLYAYKQPVISGAPPKVTYNEGGGEKATPRVSKYNYLIYIAGPSNLRIYPVEVWLLGKQYGVKASGAKKTPIEYTNVNIPEFSEPVVLVPKTTKTVLQLHTTTAHLQKGLAVAKTQAQTNELVVVYKMSGKFYYVVLKKLNHLEPIVMQ